MIERDEDAKERDFKFAQKLYQTGAWISAMDQSGGRKSEGLEREAIYLTLQKFSHEEDYRTLKNVFQIAISNNRGWDEWSRNLSNFTRELKVMVPDMPLELRQCFYDLAYTVAIRYRERNFLSIFFIGIAVSLKNFISPQTRNTELKHYIKISTTEKNALNELAEVLEMPQRIIQ